MSRRGRNLRLLLLAAPLAAACDKSDSIVVVKVAADAGVANVFQLRAQVSNGGNGTTRFLPGTPAPQPIVFETAFSLSVPRDRTGALDIALDGLDEAGTVVGTGDGSVDLHAGDNVTVTLTLRAGATACGDGHLDAGEECDDGDRLSNGACDYLCHAIGSSPGTGGQGGTGGGTAGTSGGGAAGGGGTGGTIGPGGRGGAAGRGGVFGTGGRGGAAGTGGRGGAAGTGGRGGTTGAGGGMAGTGGAAGAGGTAGVGGTSGTGGTGGTGGRPCMIELLTSGGFDMSNARWTQVTNGRPLIYDQSNIPSFVPAPHTPTRLAWLGYDVVSMKPALRQNITVPADALQVNISGYYQIQTDESGCQCDFARVQLDVAGNITPLVEWSAVNANTAWTYFATFVNATPIAGQTITLQIEADMDDGVNTSFYFDSLSAVANVCP